eukprot:4487616-Pyramimonas_sp.AAC.1
MRRDVPREVQGEKGHGEPRSQKLAGIPTSCGSHSRSGPVHQTDSGNVSRATASPPLHCPKQSSSSEVNTLSLIHI